MRPFVDANIKKSEAGDRVQKLQQALDTLGDTEGPEVDGLRAALKRAETAAQGVPIDKQVKDCEAFLSHATTPLEELERKRSAVAASISAAEQRLVALKMQQDCPPPPPPGTNAEVQRLQDLVSHLQAKLCGRDPDIPCGPVAKRPCRAAQGRVPVLSIPAELSAWLEERHADLRDALVNGDNGRILVLTTLLAEGAERMVELTGACVHGDKCKVRPPCFSSWEGVAPRPPVDQVASSGKTFESSRSQ